MKKPRHQFLGQEIQMRAGAKPGLPGTFTWRGREYQVQEIWGEWPDYGFGAAPAGRWWQRRHRTYFRVVTDTEELFDIYLDRGGKQRKWFLYRRLGRPQDPSETE